MSGPSDRPPGRDAGVSRPIVAAVVAVAGLAAAALGLVGGRAWATTFGTADCANGVCLRQVWTPSLSQALHARGWTCDRDEPTRLTCSLSTTYRDYLIRSAGDGRHPATITVRSSRSGVDTVDADLALAQWISDAALADRPADRTQARNWLAQHITATAEPGSSSVARVGKLRLALKVQEQPGTLARTFQLDLDTDLGIKDRGDS